MSKEALRCAIVDCRIPPAVGKLLCADHKLKPVTVREDIEAGPVFQHAGESHCLACQVLDSVDRTTGLCVTRCWPAWRWSPIRERGRG